MGTIDLDIDAYNYITSGVCLSSFVKDMTYKYCNTTSEFSLLCEAVYKKQKQAFEYSNY